MMTDDWGVLAEMQLREDRMSSGFLTDCRTSDMQVGNTRLSDLIPDDKEETEDNSLVAENTLLRELLRTRLQDTNFELVIQRKNDSSPLYSVKSFEQLKIPRNLLRGIYAMGFNAPSKIQETSLPTLMANPPVNMIAQAQSGTGKTASFLLSSLSRVDANMDHPQILILSPTYELTLQTGEVAKTMAKFCPDITFRYAVRGQQLQRKDKIQEHVVIGTPGKVFDWVARYKHFDIKKIKVFVLDEADVMISIQGHHDQCIRIHSMLSHECQMMLFSATYTKEVMNFAEQIIVDPVIIRLRKEELTLENVRQYYILSPSSEDKYTALQNIYGTLSIGQTIIFCNTKRTACWLGKKLSDDGHCVGYLSSDLTVEDRRSVINSFREGKEKVLITTNVSARGIDIEQVTMVINFDLPVYFNNGHADCETYLHRIGRTGRFGKGGIAVNLISNEKDRLILKEIEKHFGKSCLSVKADNAEDLEKLY